MAEPKTTNQNRGQGGPQPGTRAGTRLARQRAQKEQDGDLETLVSELETRVDRLRASYDQYFMGIEKVPPHVQLKDVERRLQDLRKIQIRNTALRFKFQTTLQKYNTYQSYWVRIARQIEEGTYKRDIRRANERFGTSTSKRGAMVDFEIDVEFDDLMSEDADLSALMSPFDESDEPDADTERPPPPPEFQPLPPMHRPDDLRRFLSLDAPDEGMPYLAPHAPIEERPSQRQMTQSGTGGTRATLPPVAAPPVKPAVAQRPPLKLLQPQAPPPEAAAPTAPSKKKSTVPPPKDPAARPARKSSARPAVNTGSGNGTKAAPPQAARRKEGSLSDERLRQLYSQYVETKRAQKESTAALSYDSLAKTLRDSSEKLAEKHGGKRVDFEVAVKDGKTILRPVVKDKT